MILNDEVLKKAQQLTQITNKTELVHMGLEALIQRESAKRLALLGGYDKTAKVVARRRV